MTRLRVLMKNLLRRGAFEDQMADEIQFHIESRTADLIRSGVRPHEAARRARLEFGGREGWKERMREASGLGLIDAVRIDLRYALRALRKNPVFACVAILSLALGIGANTAVFHLVNVVRLRALPVVEPARLASVRVKDSHGGMGVNGFPADMTYPLFEQVRDHQQALDGLFAWGNGTATIGDGADLRPVRLLWVSGQTFSTLGIAAERGRLLTPDDDRRGCGRATAVLSHALWQSQFGGRDDIIGKTLTIFMLQADVVGVAPPSFFGLEVGRAFDIALPLCASGPSIDARNVWWLSVVGRLKPGWTVERATAHLDAISPGMFEATVPTGYAQSSVDKYKTLRLEALSAANGISALRQTYDASLWLLLAMTGAVLLVACANLANLTLARANGRAREFAVRLALGASRGRLARQLLTESLLLSAIGTLAALGLARTLAGMIVDFLRTSNDPIPLDLTMDWRVFAFAATLGIVTCMLFGFTAARRSAFTSPGVALKADARSGAGQERFAFQRVLVTLQIAASLVLVVGAMLLVQTFRNLVTLDPGFQTAGVLTGFVNFARLGLPAERRQPFMQEFLERLEALPEVESAATTTNIPLFGSSWTMAVRIAGAPAEGRGSSKITFVSPGYFRTMHIPLLRGREFTIKDDKTSAGVAIVNQTFIQQFLNRPDPLGQVFETGQEPGYPAASYEIIGVVADTKYSRLREDIRPIAFVPAAQHPSPQVGAAIVMRASAATAAVPQAVRRLAADVDSRILVAGISDYDTQIRETLVRERLMAALSGFFGQLAMVIAAIGLYGLVSYVVSTRYHELGIRVALGATRANVLGLVLRQSLTLVAWGIVIGVPAALLGSRWMTSLVFGVGARDVRTIAAGVLMLAIVAIGAALIPARRAASVDPIVALRVD
jgi:putative ABC transport system permease protein